jgi:DNA-binding MarR family transcriptional regulator
MTQLYKPMLAELNLTYPQYLVMVVLWEEEGLGIKEVASRLGQDSGSITPIVKRLEAEGYLVRNRDPLDERNRVLTLTEAGQRLRAKGVHINQCIIKAVGLSQANAERLMLDLNTLNKNLAE